MSYDSPALRTISMKFDSTIHVLVRDTQGNHLQNADAFMTEVIDSALSIDRIESLAYNEDDGVNAKHIPSWVPKQPEVPSLSLKHPDCRAMVEIPAFYTFRASLPYFAQQNLLQPFHLDFKNWHNIGAGELQYELRMVHLDIYVDMVDSDGNQCNGANMQLSCESSGETYTFTNKTGMRTPHIV